MDMTYPTFYKRIFKVGALVLASALLPVLAYADHDNGKDNKGDKGDKGGGKDIRPTVPDGGPGIVLMTTVIGTVLLFGAIHRSRAKA